MTINDNRSYFINVSKRKKINFWAYENPYLHALEITIGNKSQCVQNNAGKSNNIIENRRKKKLGGKESPGQVEQ